MANKLALDANRRLATALGWTNIVDVGGALLGKPTWVCDNSRSQVPVPNWAGDWAHCGPLMVAHKCFPDIYKQEILVGEYLESNGWCINYRACEPLPPEPADLDPAIRLAIVRAVCAKLEAGQ